jgi:hypothetical protein
MNLERIPNKYSATSIIYKEHGDLIYFVKPDRADGENRTKARLLWDEKDSHWFAIIEGNYASVLGEGFFAKGPFNIDSYATENLCKYFGVSCLSKNNQGIELVSLTSPLQFKQIKRSKKLGKTSRN